VSGWLTIKRFITLSLVGILNSGTMKIKYFNDTVLEFSDNPVEETTELSENIYIDFDAKGDPVSMTIEHAKMTARVPDIAFQQIEKEAA
jgi:uncharacterized protein YuzE